MKNQKKISKKFSKEINKIFDKIIKNCCDIKFHLQPNETKKAYEKMLIEFRKLVEIVN